MIEPLWLKAILPPLTPRVDVAIEVVVKLPPTNQKPPVATCVAVGAALISVLN